MGRTATDVLNVARSQLGVAEAPAGSNLQPYGAWYGWNGVAWCAQFVSWVGWTATRGDTSLLGRFAYVPYLLAHARATGRAGTAPVRGALVCFDWNADGVADHVGIVEHPHPAGGGITTIEGNTRPPRSTGDQADGDGVYRRSRGTGDVLGYVYPDYAPDPVAPRPIGNPQPSPLPSHRPLPPLVVDGSWGPLTTGRLQLLTGALPVDGAFGPISVRALQHYLAVPATGAWDVRSKVALQRLLRATTDRTLSLDGVVGPHTVAALQRYLNARVR